MAFNFNPLTYKPYEQSFGMPQIDYQGNQLQGLMSTVNMLGESPMATGRAYENIPQFSPFAKTRQDFTTGGDSYWATGMQDDMHGGQESYSYETNTPTVFDQKGYLDARFGNINDYLNRLTNFFGNMGNNPNLQVQQGEIQRGMNRAMMPTIPTTQPSTGLSGFGNAGGWGSHPAAQGGWGSHPAFKGLLGGSGE